MAFLCNSLAEEDYSNDFWDGFVAGKVDILSRLPDYAEIYIPISAIEVARLICQDNNRRSHFEPQMDGWTRLVIEEE